MSKWCPVLHGPEIRHGTADGSGERAGLCGGLGLGSRNRQRGTEARRVGCRLRLLVHIQGKGYVRRGGGGARGKARTECVLTLIITYFNWVITVDVVKEPMAMLTKIIRAQQ